MKNVLFGLVMLSSMISFAQDDSERECNRRKYLGGQELKISNYKLAATYFLQGEKICNGYDKTYYDLLTASLINAFGEEKDEAKGKAYADTLLGVYDRATKAGIYGTDKALSRAEFELKATKPKRIKSDSLFQVGIKDAGENIQDAYVVMYYYNLLMTYNEVPKAKKPGVKSRLISEYFNLSNMVTNYKMDASTQTTLNSYLGYVIKSCDDILPDLKGFMSNLPQEKVSKKGTVNNFIALLEDKGCEESPEYAMLIDTLIAIEPSIDAFIAKAKLMKAKKKYSQAIDAFKEAKGMTEDAEVKEDIEYRIGEIQLVNLGSAKSAYQTLMNVSGERRGDALMLAAQAVAQSANTCGARTVDRKMNYYYAVELLNKAKAAGASVNSLISKYEAMYPSEGELFDNSLSKGQSAQLSCWGVSVTIK